MAETSKDDDNILTLTTKRLRKHIVIDDKKYEVADQNDFTLSEFHNFSIISEKMQEFQDSKTTKTEKEYEGMMDGVDVIIKRLIRGSTDALLQKLSHIQKMKIMTAVFKQAT